MRPVSNIVVAVVLAVLVAGGALQVRAARQNDAAVEQVRQAVQEMSRQVRLHAALGKAEVNGRGWPVTVEPSWFGAAPPRNGLVTPERPWLEIAPPEHADLVHPPVRITIDRSVAAFWYNPANGVVRARAPMRLADRSTTEVYNQINGSTLASIFSDIFPPVRGPLKAGATEEETESEEAPVEAGDAIVSVDETLEYTEENMDPTRPRDP